MELENVKWGDLIEGGPWGRKIRACGLALCVSGWMSLACCCAHIAESERTVASQVSEDSSCRSHTEMLLHRAFSIPGIVIQGNFIMLFLRSLSVRTVSHTDVTLFFAVYEVMKWTSHRCILSRLHEFERNKNLLLVWMLQHDVSLPSFCCTVNAYFKHVAGGSGVVVNIMGHPDHRTLAAYVFIC